MVKEEVEVDVEIKSPANKFHMFVGRLQHVPKATRYIQGYDLLEGDWGMVGSIVLWKLISGIGITITSFNSIYQFVFVLLFFDLNAKIFFLKMVVRYHTRTWI